MFDVELRAEMIKDKIFLQMMCCYDELPFFFVSAVTRTQTTAEAEDKTGKTKAVCVQKLHTQRHEFSVGTNYSPLCKGPLLVVFKDKQCPESVGKAWADKEHRAVVR
eukprot:gene7230-2853_t